MPATLIELGITKRESGVTSPSSSPADIVMTLFTLPGSNGTLTAGSPRSLVLALDRSFGLNVGAEASARI